MITRYSFAGVVLAAMLLVPFGTASAVSSYTITDIGLLPGGTFSSATAINSSGNVVGYSETADGAVHAFLFVSGVMTDLGGLNGKYSDSYAHDINDAGEIIGDSVAADGNFRPFRYENGKMSLLPVPGTLYSSAWGINGVGGVVGDGEIMYEHQSDDITAFFATGNLVTSLGRLPGGSFSSAVDLNDRSQIVGVSGTADSFHPFLWDTGVMIDLGTLGGRFAKAEAINDDGQIVGSSELANGDQHAFLYSDGIMSDLGTLGGDFGGITLSFAHAINRGGQIVGTSIASNGVEHAFLFANGAMVDLNTLIPPDSGWELIEVSDINDAGQIVGHGYKAGSWGFRAFLLTPSP